MSYLSGSCFINLAACLAVVTLVESTETRTSLFLISVPLAGLPGVMVSMTTHCSHLSTKKF